MLSDTYKNEKVENRLSKELSKVNEETTELVAQTEGPLGFDDDDEDDLIIPRVKVIQSLSPERKEKIADEGDILNSLTKERLNGKVFIPVYKFNTIIKWKDRADGGGIEAIARDGKICIPSDGGAPYACAHLAEFDNTKQGRDAIPTHTKYINFFGFFEGERIPIILDFSKTSYNEGKRLYSLAKVTMQNMWNHGYTLNEKEMSKAGNNWYILTATPAGPTSDEDRAFARMLFDNFRTRAQELRYDMDEGEQTDSGPNVVNQEDVENAEF